MGLMMRIRQTILAFHVKTKLCILFYTSKTHFFPFPQVFFFLIASEIAH